MTSAEKLKYLLNLPRLKAEQAIHLGLVDMTDAKAAYAAFLLAYDNPKIAQEAATAANRRLADELERRAKTQSR